MSDPVRIIVGDCLEAMRGMDAASVDAIVTDPPYGLSFMGKHWDHGVPGVDFWVEALRIAKPGTHLLAFGGTRTYHRLACAIEDAGWEVRDCIAWVYGSGFPKSLDVSKAIDKAAGAEREVVGRYMGATNIGKTSDGKRGYGCDGESTGGTDRTVFVTAPATDLARQWSGWGTALKPAFEPIIVARKPLIGTVAENVTTHGTGAMNVDGCRVETADDLNGGAYSAERKPSESEWVKHGGTIHSSTGRDYVQPAGRWPANLIHDGSDEVVGLFPSDGEQSAARFFYAAKASRRDREEGCECLPVRQTTGGGGMNDPNGDDVCGKYGSVKSPSRNHHPTVKPTALMRYLCRLVTPPGGIVLDPFAGSGSTGKGAVLEGFNFIGIELDAEYAEIARARIGNATSADKGLFG